MTLNEFTAKVRANEQDTSIRKQANPSQIDNLISNAETIKAIEDARNGIGLSRGFTSVEELMGDLDAYD